MLIESLHYITSPLVSINSCPWTHHKDSNTHNCSSSPCVYRCVYINITSSWRQRKKERKKDAFFLSSKLLGFFFILVSCFFSCHRFKDEVSSSHSAGAWKRHVEDVGLDGRAHFLSQHCFFLSTLQLNPNLNQELFFNPNKNQSFNVTKVFFN